MRFSDFQGIPNAAAAHVGPAAITAASQTLAAILAVAINPTTQFVIVKFETADVRMTVNGTTPTATLGNLFSAGDEVLLSRQQADAAKLIRAGATNGAVQISQYIS